METENPLVTFVEGSFLKDALTMEGLNDLSYNGESFF